MSTLDLNGEEREILIETLESAISDLGGEIADTKSHDYREGLKSRKKALMEILERLRQVAS